MEDGGDDEFEDGDDGFGGGDDGLGNEPDGGLGDVMKVTVDEPAADAASPAVPPAVSPPVFPAVFPAVQAVTPTMVIANIADLGFRKRAIGAGYLRPARTTPRTPTPRE